MAVKLIESREVKRISLILKNHYNLNREITDNEVTAEIVNLQRKKANGSLDTNQENLYAKIFR